MLDTVRREVDELHRFFVDWMSGAVERSDDVFRTRFLDRCDGDFVYVQPSGVAMHVRDLAPGLEGAYGKNPSFRIAVRDVRVLRQHGEIILATYVEWQRNASSPPHDNGRISSVLFRRDRDALRWLHVHETWLSPEVMAAGPYDF